MTGALVILAVLCGVGLVTGAIVLVAPRIWKWSESGQRKLRAEWESAAPSLGVEAAPPGNDTYARLLGEREGFDVSVALLPTSEPGLIDLVRVRVGGRGRWPAAVILRPADEEMSDAITLNQLGLPDPPEPTPRARTGLDDFDEAILAWGPRHDVMAMLDAVARDRLFATSLLGEVLGRWRVMDGVIESRRRLPERRPEQVALMIEHLVALARALDRGGRSTPECLADNARDDVAAMRARHLLALANGFGGSAIRQEACERALADEDPAMRLFAARALGREHAATLAELVRNENVETWIRLGALTAWEALPPPSEQVAPLLGPQLATRHRGLRVAAIRAAGRLACVAVLPSLIELTGHAQGNEASEIAIALRLLGDSSAEDALMQLLDGDGELEAVRALGIVGTVASVEPLLPFATGFAVPRALKQAARESLRAIRSRLGPADAGRLTLVDLDGAGGELSVADDASGRMSLDEDDDARPGSAS